MALRAVAGSLKKMIPAAHTRSASRPSTKTYAEARPVRRIPSVCSTIPIVKQTKSNVEFLILLRTTSPP